MGCGWRLTVLGVVFLVLVSGCICSGGEPEEPPVAGKVDEIVGSITEDPGSYSRVEEVADLGEPAVPALLEMLDDEDTYKRAAASYALSRLVFDVPESQKRKILVKLKMSFGDREPSISATAAGVLVASGDRDGIPVLIKHLGSDEPLLLIDPPETISAYSIRVLRHFTGQDFGYDAGAPRASRADALSKWVDWWNTNRESLIWDPGKGEYGGYTVK